MIRARVAIAVVTGAGLALAGCGGASPANPDAQPPSSAATTAPASPGTTTSPAWSKIDDGLSALAPEVGFLAARVTPDGTCEPIHERNAATTRPTGSQFKLYVLGALAKKVAAGEVSWDQTLTIDDTKKSIGNGEGSLQAAAPGTPVPVRDAAAKMISISDNTAADLLHELVGRDAVETQAQQWMADASANDPFLTTREMFLLHYVPGLGERYLTTPPEQRDAFLASEVDTRPLTDIGAGLTAAPRLIDEVEWFASPRDICTAFAGLHELSSDAPLAPLSPILSGEVRGLDLDPAAWPTIWYKGGSEPGVLTMGWLATNAQGETFVVEAMLSNPDAALSNDSLDDLVAVAKDAFGLLG